MFSIASSKYIKRYHIMEILHIDIIIPINTAIFMLTRMNYCFYTGSLSMNSESNFQLKLNSYHSSIPLGFDGWTKVH